MAQLESKYQEESQSITETWDRIAKETNARYAEIENAITMRQEQEQAELGENLERAIPEKPKPSAKYLNIKRIQQNLAKQMKYLP